MTSVMFVSIWLATTWCRLFSSLYLEHMTLRQLPMCTRMWLMFLYKRIIVLKLQLNGMCKSSSQYCWKLNASKALLRIINIKYLKQIWEKTIFYRRVHCRALIHERSKWFFAPRSSLQLMISTQVVAYFLWSGQTWFSVIIPIYIQMEQCVILQMNQDKQRLVQKSSSLFFKTIIT